VVFAVGGGSLRDPKIGTAKAEHLPACAFRPAIPIMARSYAPRSGCQEGLLLLHPAKIIGKTATLAGRHSPRSRVIGLSGLRQLGHLELPAGLGR
jgi:hypothetical protein